MAFEPFLLSCSFCLLCFYPGKSVFILFGNKASCWISSSRLGSFYMVSLFRIIWYVTGRCYGYFACFSQNTEFNFFIIRFWIIFGFLYFIVFIFNDIFIIWFSFWIFIRFIRVVSIISTSCLTPILVWIFAVVCCSLLTWRCFFFVWMCRGLFPCIFWRATYKIIFFVC